MPSGGGGGGTCKELQHFHGSMAFVVDGVVVGFVVDVVVAAVDVAKNTK